MSDMSPSDPSAAHLAPGTRLNGIFEVDQRIASGGMGEIYRGHAIETGDPVAIKVMRADLADNAIALALFRKEASALHYIQHEAIVRYYIFSQDPATRRHYLAMEFVDGEPLSDLLKRGPLGFDEVCKLQQRLAAGLDAAHQHGIIHRDLSPDNVLIPGKNVGGAKIIDFGIARSTRFGDGTVIGSGFAGKYGYVSPEQLGLYGGQVTAKSDIYSLGLVLAECLTGRPLEMGGSQFEVIEKRRVVPDLGAVDGRMRPLIEQMLQPNPDDRPESMTAVAAWRAVSRPVPAPVPAARAASHNAAQKQKRAADASPARRSGMGRKFALGALALVLLLGVGSFGLYFVPDILAPPAIQPLPEAPLLENSAGARQAEEERRAAAEREAAVQREAAERRRQESTAAAKHDEDERLPQQEANLKSRPDKYSPQSTLSPNERLPADPKERISRFVDAYDGGDCFFVTPVTIAESKATLEGYGSSVAPFEVLDYEFKRQNGFEASIGVHQITPAQCAAVSFLTRARKGQGATPHLEISAAALRSGGALTGAVADFGDRNVELLLVADDGFVHNLTNLLKLAGSQKSFNIRMQKNDPGAAQPQLLIAIAGTKPLEALKPAQLGNADQVFPQLLAESLRTGQSLTASAKYFKLEN